MNGETGFWTFFAWWAPGVVVILAERSLFGRLVKIERDRHSAAWEDDGRPRAPSLGRRRDNSDPDAPPELPERCSKFVLFLRWLVRTPLWMRDDPQALRLLWTLRALLVAGVAFEIVAQGHTGLNAP
jgi:hypothetical protein